MLHHNFYTPFPPREVHDSGGKSKKNKLSENKKKGSNQKKIGKKQLYTNTKTTQTTQTRDLPQMTEFLVMCIFQFLEQLTKASHCVTESVRAAVFSSAKPLRKSTIFRGQKKIRTEMNLQVGWDGVCFFSVCKR